jgi:hypothetical protein
LFFEKFKKQDLTPETLQKSLFNNDEKVSFSNSEKERCKIIKKFNERCKRDNLQIAFKTTRGFKSCKPNNFLNFWFYKPQSEKDKSPIK